MLGNVKKGEKVVYSSLMKLYQKEYRLEQNLLLAFNEYYQRLKASTDFIPLPISSVLDWTKRESFQTLRLYENYQ